jgi:hypothetical protein
LTAAVLQVSTSNDDDAGGEAAGTGILKNMTVCHYAIIHYLFVENSKR